MNGLVFLLTLENNCILQLCIITVGNLFLFNIVWEKKYKKYKPVSPVNIHGQYSLMFCMQKKCDNCFKKKNANTLFNSGHYFSELVEQEISF